MHYSLSSDQQTDIAAQLVAKGFLATERILDTAQEIIAEIDTIGKSGILLYDDRGDKEPLFSFFFTSENKETYSLDSIRATYQWHSPLSNDDLNIINRRHSITDGPIPNKPEFDREITQQITQVKHMVDSLRTNPAIANEFSRLGFDEYPAMLQTSSHYSGSSGDLITRLNTHLITKVPGQEADGRLDFEFQVISPGTRRDPYINIIKATLSGVTPRQGKEVNDLTKYFYRPGLLSKQRIDRSLFASLMSEQQIFDRIRELFKKDPKNKEGPEQTRKKGRGI